MGRVVRGVKGAHGSVHRWTWVDRVWRDTGPLFWVSLPTTWVNECHSLRAIMVLGAGGIEPSGCGG